MYSEAVLTQFSREPEVWKQCLYFICNSNDEFVLMFCLNILEVNTLYTHCYLLNMSFCLHYYAVCFTVNN